MEALDSISDVPIAPSTPDPPLKVSRVDRSDSSAEVEVPTSLRVALMVLAVGSTALLTLFGLVVGMAWTFSSCFKQTCSGTAADAFWLSPLIGFAIGTAFTMALWFGRARLYQYPVLIWLPAMLVGSVLALIVLLGLYSTVGYV